MKIETKWVLLVPLLWTTGCGSEIEDHRGGEFVGEELETGEEGTGVGQSAQPKKSGESGGPFAPGDIRLPAGGEDAGTDDVNLEEDNIDDWEQLDKNEELSSDMEAANEEFLDYELDTFFDDELQASAGSSGALAAGNSDIASSNGQGFGTNESPSATGLLDSESGDALLDDLEEILTDSDDTNVAEADQFSNDNIGGDEVIVGGVEGELVTDDAVDGDFADSIDDDQVTDDAVDDDQVTDAAVDGDQVTDAAVDGDQVTDAAVDGDQVTDAAVDGDQVTDESADTKQVADNATDNDHISNDTTDSDQSTDGQGGNENDGDADSPLTVLLDMKAEWEQQIVALEEVLTPLRQAIIDEKEAIATELAEFNLYLDRLREERKSIKGKVAKIKSTKKADKKQDIEQLKDLRLDLTAKIKETKLLKRDLKAPLQRLKNEWSELKSERKLRKKLQKKLRWVAKKIRKNKND